ncbi:MAG: TetR family transcriptional regulator [Brotaphodocola sp.]
MPTERFYRLPEVKRRIILEAAKKEFARVPFEKASINQIIHNADISRGSFYTYFEDKQDVVRCIFEEDREAMEAVCRNALDKNHGDYLEMLEHLFDYFVTMLQQTRDYLQMVKNVFSYQENTKMFNVGDFSLSEEDDSKSPVLWFMDKIDQSKLRWNDIGHFKAMAAMGAATLMIAVKQYYEYPDCLEQVRKNYLTSLELLRYGAYRDEFKN